ncbi:MAG: slipin family protein, partial [Streptosporangiaceae bacterium]
DPAALQLRLLQTVVEVAAEKNSTLVMPVPVELLRFFDRAGPAISQAEPSAAPGTDTPPSLPAPGASAVPVPAALPAGAALAAPFNTVPKEPAIA